MEVLDKMAISEKELKLLLKIDKTLEHIQQYLED